MKLRFFNLAAATSLLLAVAVSVLWLRSYWRYEGVWRDGGKTYQSLVSFGGRLEYSKRAGFNRGNLTWRYNVKALPGMTRYQPMVEPKTWYGHLGFSYSNDIWNAGPGWPVHDVDLTLPHWSLAILLSIFPGWRAIAWRRRRNCGGRGFEVGGNQKTPGKTGGQ